MKALLALLPLVCVALAGGTTPWSQAVMLVLVGAVLIVSPPRYSLGWRLNGVMLALVALASTAFLPARWFSLPGWRSTLGISLQTPLPDTLSPQPWLSADALAVFLLGLCWLYLVATAAWTAEERLRAGRIFAVGVAVLSTSFVVLNKLGIAVPIWHGVKDFGPFPNRNQTANFLAVGSLPALACARVAWQARRFPAMAGWLLAWMAAAVGVFNDYSRAGIGILFAGSVAYLGYETLRQSGGGRRKAEGGRKGRLAVAVSLVLLLASGFFVSGGETLQRVRGELADASAGTVSSEFRLRIQRDALDLVAASPWCGVGLGNFTGVFAEYRTRSAIPSRAIHPESDWLWAAGEMGWLSLGLVILGLALLARRMWPPRRGPDRPLRGAAVVAVALFALHAFVDVPAHRLGTVMCALLLAGLALPGRGETRSTGQPALIPARWPGFLFRVLGLGFVALGVLWWQSGRGAWDLPGAFRLEHLRNSARTLQRMGDDPGTEQAATRALALAPLDWSLYSLRAAVRVNRRADVLALADFRRARYLEPFYGSVPEQEGQLWALARLPDQAADALLEACRREPGNSRAYVNSILGAAAGNPALRGRIIEAVEHDPAVQIEALSLFNPPESIGLITDAVQANPELKGYDDAQRQQFLELWARKGDARTLVDAMNTHRGWQAAGWRAWAEAESRLDHLPEACAIMAAHVPPPVLPRDAGGAERASRAEMELAVASNPGNPLFALRLFRARQADGDPVGALAALRPIISRPDCPGYFFYLEATTAGEAGQWPEAWEAWARSPSTPR